MKRETFLRYIEAWNKGDLQKVTSYYAKDLEFESFGNRRIGPEAIAYLEGLHKTVKDEIVPRSIEVNGDRIEMDADLKVVALVDLPTMAGGAMKKGDRRTVRIKGIYETGDDVIRRIRIVNTP